MLKYSILRINAIEINKQPWSASYWTESNFGLFSYRKLQILTDSRIFVEINENNMLNQVSECRYFPRFLSNSMGIEKTESFGILSHLIHHHLVPKMVESGVSIELVGNW
jgi:hypothetical protein